MAKKLIVGLVGFKSSGKDTVANTLIKHHNFVRDSFAAPLKDSCAQIFNWPRALLEGDTEESRTWREESDIWWSKKLDIPNFSPRVAMQLVGTNAIRNHFHPDIWLLSVLDRMENGENNRIVITDNRFRNEIDLIHSMDGLVVRVRRGPDPEWFDTAVAANNGNKIAIQEMERIGIHASEWDWIGIDPDAIIENNGTLKDLEFQTNQVAKRIL